MSDIVKELRQSAEENEYLLPANETMYWAAADEIERLRVENIQMRFALGYSMPAELERHILPSNPFKCGMCEARAALEGKE